jgi:hypothetical protein
MCHRAAESRSHGSERIQLSDAVELHNGRAMDAQKGAAVHCSSSAFNDSRIRKVCDPRGARQITGSFDPVDVLGGYKEPLLAHAHGELPTPPRRTTPSSSTETESCDGSFSMDKSRFNPLIPARMAMLPPLLRRACRRAQHSPPGVAG